jgi:hypothetical protein
MIVRVMRWLLAGFFSCALIGAAPAFADDTQLANPSGVTYRPAAIHLAGPLQRATRPTARGIVRVAMYMLQAIDASQSAHAVRAGGREENVMLRPFSHGGALTMDLGFALGDVVREFTFRRTPESVQLSADALQAATNLDGILQTSANRR